MRFIAAVFFVLAVGSNVWAQSSAPGPVPDRRVAITRDLDFFGSDLQAIFNTTFDTCHRSCLVDQNCVGFTFNENSNACFPKSSLGDTTPYEGALSGRVYPTDARVLANAQSRLGDLTFLSGRQIDAARNLAERLGKYHYAGEWGVDDLLAAAQRRENDGNTTSAMRFTGAALSLSDASETWVEYARLLAVSQSDNSSTRRAYRQRAIAAAVNGYLRAGSDAQRVNALIEMARALETEKQGRVGISALRLAQSISSRDDADVLLSDLLAKYGFRVTGHDTESDLEVPRICAEFSEDLQLAGLDYTPYVALPQANLAVEVQERKLCVSGFVHGERYKVTFRKGLPAASGEVLAKNIDINAYVRDRSPMVRFPSRAYVLPRSADAGLPIQSVNLAEVDLTLYRVSDRNLLRAIQDNYFGRPLSYWSAEGFSRDVAEEIWTGTGELSQTLNQEVTTRLPMGEAIADRPAGIYALEARVRGDDPYDVASAMQWFVLSDLGVASATGVDGLHVFVRSLGTAEVKAGAEVTLLSNANAVLGTAVTDAQGYAHFAPGLTRGLGGSSPALLTVTDGSEDIAFLPLTDPEFDLSDRGVEGRPPAPPIDVFLTTDRGAYRAGETVHATALLRDQLSRAVADMPVTAVLMRPDGVEYSRQLSDASAAGGHVMEMPIGGSAPTGPWKLRLFGDPEAPALAQAEFLVEDFLPERIDFELDLGTAELRAGEDVQIDIDAQYLFGAPAADLPLEGTMILRAVHGLEAWPGYQFGRYDMSVEARYQELPLGYVTDAAGQAQLRAPLPEIEGADRPLEAEFVVRVSEGSGRPIERREKRLLGLTDTVIGVKPMFDAEVPEGSEARFQLIALGQGQSTAPTTLSYSVNRVTTRYQWYQQYGSWNWEPIHRRTKVAGGTVEFTGAPVEVSAPVEWGRYEIVVEQVGADYTASSVDFYAGWYVSADATETPDVLAVSLDAAQYRAGDTANLRVVPRYPGKALITVMSNRLIDMKVVDVVAGENMVSLPVTEDWGGGAYVSATVIRPMDVAAGHNAARALGLSYAPVDPGAKVLTAQLDVPVQSTPRATLPVKLRVDGVLPGETAYATIAAVDVGILNLTGFQSPDPTDHYFGQRRLGMGLRDVYGRLIDGLNGNMGTIRSGGDAGRNPGLQAPPPTEELVAYFSGPITVGPDGMAQTAFDMPAFNGTVRLMAVVWSDTGVAEAEADVLVRDPVVVTASLPRFLAPGDQSRLLLEITHATGPSGRMGLDVTANGVALLGQAPSGLDLNDQGTVRLSLPVRADTEGLHQIDVALTTPDGKQLLKTLTIPVQRNDPEISRTHQFNVAAGSAFLFDANVFAGFAPGSGSSTLTVGPLAQFDAPGLLSALDRYPYGCTEQITSRAMPLLYLDSVALAMGLDSRDGIAKRVDQAIAEVLTNQNTNGAFGLWRPSQGDTWLDAYVTDFLSRAKSQGFTVPDTAFRMALDNLRNQVNYASDFDKGGEDLAYAMLVLAREGAASMGDLRYFADVKGRDFGTSLATAQIGAALAAYGDQIRADKMFALASQQAKGWNRKVKSGSWRHDYGTSRRDAAAVLTLAVESGSTAVDRDLLIEAITPDEHGRSSTQENMWSLMAANALINDRSVNGFTVNGAPSSGPLIQVLEAQTAGNTSLEIRNGSDRSEVVTLTTFGVPEVPEPANGNGYAISREYYTLEGQPADMGALSAGDRLVAVLTVTPTQKLNGRLMVNDPLPAGLEIDNPRLLQSGDLKALSWLGLHTDTQNTEYRQDRFLAAVDYGDTKSFQLAYTVRAISPGIYHHPAASVEDMYRPQFRAHSDTGRVVIAE